MNLSWTRDQDSIPYGHHSHSLHCISMLALKIRARFIPPPRSSFSLCPEGSSAFGAFAVSIRGVEVIVIKAMIVGRHHFIYHDVEAKTYEHEWPK